MNFIRKIFGNKQTPEVSGNPIQSQQPDIKKLEENGDIKGLIQALSYKEDSRVRKEATWALSKIGGESAVKPLIDALQDSDKDVSRTAINALGKIGALEPLIAVLNDSNNDMNLRVLVVDVLANTGDIRAVEPLIGLLKGNLRIIAASALGKLGDARAVEPLTAMILDTDNSNAAHMGRYSAMDALIELGKKLGKTRDASAVGSLITILKDTSLLPDAPHKVARVFAEIDFVIPEHRQAIAPLIARLVNHGLDFGKALGETSIYLQALNRIDRTWQNSDEARSAIPMLGEIIRHETRNKGYEPPPNETSRRNNAIDLVVLIDTPVIEPLVSALASWSASVRYHAQEVLDRYYPDWPSSEAAKQAIPNLMKAIEDGSKYPNVSNDITRAASDASNALSKIRSI